MPAPGELPRTDSPLVALQRGLAAHAAVIEAAKQAGVTAGKPTPAPSPSTEATT